MSPIQSVTKYTVMIGEKEKTFNTEAEAVAALAKIEMAGEAQAYVDQLTGKDGQPLSDKDKKGKFNVVLDYLAYKATVSVDPEAFEQA